MYYKFLLKWIWICTCTCSTLIEYVLICIDTIEMYDKYIGPIFQSSYSQWVMAMLLLDWPLTWKLPGLVVPARGMVFLPMQIRTYCVELMSIFKFISKETCNTKKVTFHVYFYYVKCFCGGSKGKRIQPIWVYFGHIRLVYSSFAYWNSFSKKLVIQKALSLCKVNFDRSKGGKNTCLGCIVAWHY